MTLAEDMLSVVYEGRSLAGEEGFRVHSVALVEVLNSGSHPGTASGESVVTAITEANSQPPKVRWLKDEEVAVGALGPGTIEVGPITPLFDGGGTDLTKLQGADLATNDQLYLLITGPKHPTGAYYRITDLQCERALRYMIRAAPVTPA